ncbi:unnamed protein product [Prorocentrum cordatum]|uniref:U-box domain-containing protein n=1 Tax=Prorocentrum cordatum TaxID=2364126 RepID=A0ABN9X6T9_9DINO|nr:unnamed protein product [Polarella glacialis]
MLENIIDLCDLYRAGQRTKGSIPTGLFALVEPEPMLTLLCLVMASDSHVKDPSLRGKAVKLMNKLCFAFPTWQQLWYRPPFSKQLVPCLLNVFIGVEKAIMSYYDLSDRYKYHLRLPVIEIFETVLQDEGHRQILDEFCKTNPDTLAKMLTQLINDLNSQTEEGIRTVKEYQENKHKDSSGGASSSAPSGPAAVNHDEEVVADDTTGEANEDIYRRSRMNYKEHAKKYFGLASRTWKMLWLLCKHVGHRIVEGHTILEQLLHTSLDAQLHFLVGPEMKNIKSSPQEYDELGFNPKELIKQIVEIYLFLVRANKVEVTRVVGKDERYYKPETFSKAVRFVKKHGLLNVKEGEDFDVFVKGLAEHTAQQRSAFDQADIPEEFLCEMMADIMSDPVQFPQSKKVVDRWVAERQIMSTDLDPYANTPVKKEDLIPMTELRERIHRFAQEKGIELEGGNMFG